MTDLRVCPKCGTSNESERVYCWVCFDKFDAPGVPSASRPANPSPGPAARGNSRGNPWSTPFGVVASIVAIGLTLLFVKSLGFRGVFPLVLVLPFLFKDSGFGSTSFGSVVRAIAMFFLIVISSTLLVLLTCFRMGLIR